MLKNVLDVCRANRVKLIYPSGWEVYSGYRSEKLLASEALPRLPKGPYGEAKYLSEIFIENHHRNHGINYAIIRSAPVYGGGDRPKFIYNFIEKALRGDPILAHRYLNGPPSIGPASCNRFRFSHKGACCEPNAGDRETSAPESAIPRQKWPTLLMPCWAVRAQLDIGKSNFLHPILLWILPSLNQPSAGSPKPISGTGLLRMVESASLKRSQISHDPSE